MDRHHISGNDYHVYHTIIQHLVRITLAQREPAAAAAAAATATTTSKTEDEWRIALITLINPMIVEMQMETANTLCYEYIGT